jgi:hypothetical protein
VGHVADFAAMADPAAVAVDSHEPEPLAEAILSLLSDESRRLAVASAHDWAMAHDSVHTANSFEALPQADRQPLKCAAASVGELPRCNTKHGRSSSRAPIPPPGCRFRRQRRLPEAVGRLVEIDLVDRQIPGRIDEHHGVDMVLTICCVAGGVIGIFQWSSDGWATTPAPCSSGNRSAAAVVIIIRHG